MLPEKIHFFDALKLATAFALAVLALNVIYAIADVFLIFFTAVILAIAMDQPISRLEVRKIPRMMSAIILYVAALVSIVLMLYVVLPPLTLEFKSLVTTYPVYSEALLGPGKLSTFEIAPYLRSFSESIVGSPEALWSTVFKTFGGFTSFLAIFFIAFFLTVQSGGIRSSIYPFVPVAHRESATLFFDRVQERVASWLWGKTLSSLIVGFLTLISLLIVGVPYALVLAVFAVFLNFIPFIGPIIAAVPAVALAMGNSTAQGFIVALLYFIINGVLESFVFGPLLMRKAVHINPALLILCVISGAYLGGVLGIIIAIPATAVIYLGVMEYLARRHGEATEV